MTDRPRLLCELFLACGGGGMAAGGSRRKCTVSPVAHGECDPSRRLARLPSGRCAIATLNCAGVPAIDRLADLALHVLTQFGERMPPPRKPARVPVGLEGTARGPAALGAGPHIAVKADATGVTEDVGHSGLPLQVSAFKHRSPPADLRSPSIPWGRGYGQNGAGTSGSDAQWPGNPPVHGQNRLV
jgi:hypothetical protein